MDKRGDRRPDKRPYQQGKRGRGHELGTLRDVTPRQHERHEQQQPKQQKTTGEKTRCEHCSGLLRACGAVGRAGHLRWKCRKCGRTVWVRPDFKPPVPIVPVSKARALGG